MDVTRRDLLRSVSPATVAGGAAGCTLGYRDQCRPAADSLETTVAAGDRSDLDALDGTWPMRYNEPLRPATRPNPAPERASSDATSSPARGRSSLRSSSEAAGRT